jgi:hypothetical protein
MPRRDDRRRRTAGDGHAAERQNWFPQLLPIEVPRSMLRKRAKQRAVAVRLSEKTRVGEATLAPTVYGRRVGLREASPSGADCGNGFNAQPANCGCLQRLRKMPPDVIGSI